jgi:hypothetical protein
MDGNGSSKVIIHTQDMGGWLRLHTDRPSEEADNLPVFLSHSLTAWLRQHPQFTLRCMIPVTRDGHTVELHAWYDLHVFPDLSGQKPQEVK